MQYIDERFKDDSPEQTVARIKALLKGLGMELEEKWTASGIENCWSVNVSLPGGFPFFSNGKGVTRELARASAYGEFIERLSCGLHLYKLQSIHRDPAVAFHSYAPDGRYMTAGELEAEGEWMDHVIAAYGKGLTRKKLASLCKTYACADREPSVVGQLSANGKAAPNGQVYAVPFYSLFEDKYVYLPIEFVTHVYATNGCCAGNTREEAWVHGLSEMMERHSTIHELMSGRSAPAIPEKVLEKFPTVMKILDKIRSTGIYDVQILDMSLGNGLPVVATRIINKKTQDHMVNIGADPVLEIAVQRTLTELFQGKNLDTFTSQHGAKILKDISQVDHAHNTLNQMETGNGLFTADFFAEELTCHRGCTVFEDRSGMDNKELLADMLGLYRELGRPVYVRNFSYLGFPSYQFVVPGFSETRGELLTEPVSEYGLGDQAAKALRYPENATISELAILLLFHKKMQSVYSRRNSFSRLAGLPLTGPDTNVMLYVTLSYAAWRLGKLEAAKDYLEPVLAQTKLPEDVRLHLACLSQYLGLKLADISEEKIRVILGKFFEEHVAAGLFDRLDGGKSPYDGYLLRCDCRSCDTCAYASHCNYDRLRQVISATGQAYAKFAHGQDREHFLL